MEQYIEDVLGCHIQYENYQLPPQLPQYLLNDYSYRKYTIEGQECLFVIPCDFSLPAYKKQYPRIRQITKFQVVLQLKTITPYQRKTLIAEHIPFVVENMQIYLPFLAISLVEKYQEKIEIEKFTPITQLVFLYLFYNQKKITATELAQILNCSTMSVIRAYRALVDCGLFVSENKGAKKYIVPKANGGELLKDAEEFLINPIEKRLYVNKDSDMSGYLTSGIYALSKKTMLNAAENDLCYAIFQKAHSELPNTVPKSSYLEGTAIAAEKWSYDPMPLTKDETVDDISLILSLSGTKDERIQIEIDRLRRIYQW